MMKTYTAKEGSRISDTQAKILAAEFQRIEKNAGALTPELLVDRARPPDSPIHNLFDWDDARAAESWRLSQARVLIASVCVSIQTRTEEKIQVKVTRAWQHVNAHDDERRFEGSAYINLGRAMRDQRYRQQILERAKESARSWMRTYHLIRDLMPMSFEALERETQ